MLRSIVLYAVLLAAGATLLQWIQYQYAVKVLATELYILLLAIGFTILGVWAGHRLNARPKQGRADVNQQALDYLKISEREQRVLELLVAGHSNQEIADKLFVSPNTVKTHLANLYRKLEVSRRAQAINKAHELNLVSQKG